MKKITIAGSDLQALLNNDLTKKYAVFLIENCKRSKYAYNGKETKTMFYYCETSEKMLNELKEIFIKNTFLDLSVYFIIEVFKKLKNKPEEENEENEEFGELPF